MTVITFFGKPVDLLRDLAGSLGEQRIRPTGEALGGWRLGRHCPHPSRPIQAQTTPISIRIRFGFQIVNAAVRRSVDSPTRPLARKTTPLAYASEAAKAEAEKDGYTVQLIDTPRVARRGEDARAVARRRLRASVDAACVRIRLGRLPRFCKFHMSHRFAGNVGNGRALHPLSRAQLVGCYDLAKSLRDRRLSLCSRSPFPDSS